MEPLDCYGARSKSTIPASDLVSRAILGPVGKTCGKVSPFRGCSQFELMVQGNLEVMISEDCLPCAGFKDAIRSTNFWGLQDFKRMFPFWLDND